MDSDIKLQETDDGEAPCVNTFTLEPVQCSESSKGPAAKSVAEIFKERLQKMKKETAREMSFSDKIEARDTQCLSEFAGEIFAHLRQQEEGMQLAPDYLSKVQLPTEVKDTSRAFLVEWIIDVRRKFRLMPETLYNTVYIIDRFLSL